MDEIPSLVQSSLETFGSLIKFLQLEDPAQEAIARSHLTRFKLWAGSVGATRQPGMPSLTYRLRDSSMIRCHVISVLGELQKSLEEARSLLEPPHSANVGHNLDFIDLELAKLLDDTTGDASDEKSRATEVVQCLTQTGEVVDCLLRLSVTINNPAPLDHLKSRVDPRMIHFELYDIKHVQEKFPNLDPAITQRLGRAMTRQRQYIKYRADQHSRLQENSVLDEAENARSEGGGRTRFSSLPQNVGDYTQIDLTVSKRPAAETSATSSAGSRSADVSKFCVPLLPKEHSDRPLLCPFCFMLIPVQTRDEWKKHVFEVLRPYVCIWNDCVSSEQNFQDQRDWIHHMITQHWRVWGCPFGCPTAFDDCRALEAHLRSTHSGELTAERVKHVSTLSSRTDKHKAQGKCPMCQKVEVKTINEYGSHIGYHLEQLALFVLPAMGDFDRNDHRNTKVETEEHGQRQEDRVEIEPRASGKSAEVDLDDIDESKAYHKDTFSRAGSEVKATSEDDISTKLSGLQLDDLIRLRRKLGENEIKPGGAQEGHFESPLTQGDKPDKGKNKEKSMHGAAELRSSQKDGQGSTTPVDQPTSLDRSSMNLRQATYFGAQGRSSSSRRSRYVNKRKWHCTWCDFGPMDWDKHCSDCGRARDQYSRVEY